MADVDWGKYDFTNKILGQIKYYNLSREGIVATYNDAHRWDYWQDGMSKCTRVYQHDGYEVGVVYKEEKGRVIFISCWKRWL
ncbi:hypothetical protein M1563_04695 [Patescibacteria group bacterium]|nr:hypothetical protein [Patescibacteria group bacterium]MCL5409548.1 hypothetical protein [Patescibacteria group bacterium]